MSIITGYNSHFEVHVIIYDIMIHINTPCVHTCSSFYLAVTANLVRVFVLLFNVIMSEPGDDTTAKTLAEMQATMKLFHEELKALKSGATSVSTNPLEAVSNQPLDTPRGGHESSNPSFRPGETGQRKRG